MVQIKKRLIIMEKISVIVPCYNEKETINIFYKEITNVA